MSDTLRDECYSAVAELEMWGHCPAHSYGLDETKYLCNCPNVESAVSTLVEANAQGILLPDLDMECDEAHCGSWECSCRLEFSGDALPYLNEVRRVLTKKEMPKDIAAEITKALDELEKDVF